MPSLRQTDFQPLFRALEIGALPCGGQKRATGTFLSRTPRHIGAATNEAQKRIGGEVVEIIKNF